MDIVTEEQFHNFASMTADHPVAALTVTGLQKRKIRSTHLSEKTSQAEAGEVLLSLGQASSKRRAKSVLVRREVTSSAAESLSQLRCDLSSGLELPMLLCSRKVNLEPMSYPGSQVLSFFML